MKIDNGFVIALILGTKPTGEAVNIRVSETLTAAPYVKTKSNPPTLIRSLVHRGSTYEVVSRWEAQDGQDTVRVVEGLVMSHTELVQVQQALSLYVKRTEQILLRLGYIAAKLNGQHELADRFLTHIENWDRDSLFEAIKGWFDSQVAGTLANTSSVKPRAKWQRIYQCNQLARGYILLPSALYNQEVADLLYRKATDAGEVYYKGKAARAEILRYAKDLADTAVSLGSDPMAGAGDADFWLA